jgi:hypothetical protein
MENLDQNYLQEIIKLAYGIGARLKVKCKLLKLDSPVNAKGQINFDKCNFDCTALSKGVA